MKDLLALANDPGFRGSNMQYAASLGSAFGSSLTAAHVLAPCPSTFDFAPPALASEVIDICREQFNKATLAGKSFAARVIESKVACSSHIAEGSLLDAVVTAAIWHDALVLERGPEISWVEAGKILLSVDVPCFLIPAHHDGFRLETVAVAWDGSTHAARAIHGSLPLLRRASRILLIDGSAMEPLADRFGPPEQDIESRLNDLGTAATRICIDPGVAEAGERILSVAANDSCDLLVMGAYGRTRFSEWLFGGATRYVLEHASIPLLMRH